MAVLALVGSSANLPDPPYPDDTKAKGWRFDLDLERAESSDTWALCPEEIRPWLLMLWAKSWMAVPCGSFTNDEGVIAARIGMPLNLFRAHREVLLRGWRLHSDGRLYHHVVTEAVMRLLDVRNKTAQRQEEWRQRRSLQNQQSVNQITRDGRVSNALLTAPSPSPSPSPAKENPTAKARLSPLPDWIPPTSWSGFVEMRQRIKKPLTQRAQDLLVAKLDRMRQAGHDVGQILDASTLNAWQDVYEPKARGSPPIRAKMPDLLSQSSANAIEEMQRRMEE